MYIYIYTYSPRNNIDSYIYAYHVNTSYDLPTADSWPTFRGFPRPQLQQHLGGLHPPSHAGHVQRAAAVFGQRSHQVEGAGGALRHQGPDGLAIFPWEN